MNPDTALTTRLRETARAGIADLKRRFAEGMPATELLAERARQVDALLCELWDARQLPDDLALVAVGGYGRGELYPGSDVDLLILLPEPAAETLAGQLESLVIQFWDAGLEVGHSVRTIEECLSEADRDISTETALLESRRLAGNEGLFERFRTAFHSRLHPVAFYRAKVAEQDERYRKHNETPYSLEPNCKESPGGLRDLQVVMWVARACGCGFGCTWDDLCAHGIVTADETANLVECEAFLQDLRVRLHFHAGRREDRLIFDVQRALAEAMGYQAVDDRRASEQMMQAYYKNAKSVTQLNTLILQNIGVQLLEPERHTPPEPIDDAFRVCDRMLDITRPDVFDERPSRLLEAFRHLQDLDLRGMTAGLLRGLWRSRNLIDDRFRADPVNRRLFLELLQSENGLIQEFRRMNQWGILGRYLPAFGRIVGQMQHDLFHVYTVDQHILQVMRNLRRFTMDEHGHEYPFESRLMNGFDRPWVLYVAALFHDIAKGRGGDHSELGMADARAFCDDHGISGEDADLIVWLVREHLTMSRIAQKDDIADPAVVRSFAEKVGTERRLTALYLLTVADIRGTSPKVWNGWKAQLLSGLYRGTASMLRAGKPPEIHGAIAERQRDAMRLLRFFALPESVQDQLWKYLDTVYFARHSADEIAWHARSLHYRLSPPHPIVKARLYRHDSAADATDTPPERAAGKHESQGIQVLVYSRDQPDLFLHVVAFFARAGFSIADAKIHTTKHGYALDSFVLLDVQERESERDLIPYIEFELAERLGPKGFLDAPTSGRVSRQVRHFPFKPQIQLWPDDRGDKYLLSIVAADRPGLLYTVASTLAKHRINVETAKIATLGERVEDVFLVSRGDLGQSARRLELETELVEALTI
jgi:[protein-PII] uridylyltransferase